MSNWKNSIADALRPTQPPGAVSEYEGVVREVTDFVNQSDRAFRAEVRSRYIGNLQRIDVLTHPRRLPVERSIMLSISISASGDVMVPENGGLGHLKDASPDGLRKYLVDFFTSENFVATVAHYRRRNEEPVQGWLKRLHYRKVDLADVGILTSADQQDKLVGAYDGSNFTDKIEIVATLMTPVGNFRSYNDATQYAMLDSGGFVLRVVRHESAGIDSVRIVGVPLADVDWRSSE